MGQKNLSIIDTAFLALERRTMPLHVGLLMLFKPPAGAEREYAARIAQRLSSSIRASAPFNQRPQRKLGRYTWVEDEQFDLAHHFTHISLPQPGRVRELLALVSQLHSLHLDRAYPLWSWHLIEGLEDGRIAAFVKIHHALADGVAVMRLLFKSWSTDAEASMRMPPPWELPSLESSRPTAIKAVSEPIVQRMRSTVPITRQLAAELLRTWRDYRANHQGVVNSARGVRTILNSSITASRRVAAQSYAMTRFRALSKALGCSTNDLVLSVTSGGLRYYLHDQNALPDAPLLGVVPVSVRGDEFTDSGNEVAFALINLATDVADPVERLQAIKASMDYYKERFKRMKPIQIQAYSVAQLLPGALAWLNRFGQARVPVNVVISHVPAPRQKMYWQGCELDGLYPASVIADTVAVNISLVSRLEAIDFGVVGCRKSLPSLQRLLVGFEQSLAELEAAVLKPEPVETIAPTTPQTTAPKPKRRRKSESAPAPA
jgi:diacylglycerol O-acyltransferase